jgi:2-isopropylmalate synthase
MRKIQIVDVSLREQAACNGSSLSFKEKIEVARQLDKLNVDAIETAPIVNGKNDIVFLHTLAPLMTRCILACPVGLDPDLLPDTWEALRVAKHPRLNVIAPVSTVQMEYQFHKKPPVVLDMIRAQVKACRELCEDVELTLHDATRAETEFLAQTVRVGIEAGAGVITVCDTAGVMLPDEFNKFVAALNEAVPELANVTLSFEYSNALHMAAACIFASVNTGFGQVKTTCAGMNEPSLRSIAHVFRAKGDALGVSCGLNMTVVEKSYEQIRQILSGRAEQDEYAEAPAPVSGEVSFALSNSDSREAVADAARQMGYDLDSTALDSVYESVQRIAQKKMDTVGPKELEAIIGTVSLQVPPTYNLKSFVITSGNEITSYAHVILERGGVEVKGHGTGDGPIDAAFLALEEIIGQHIELDDFQIQSVTGSASAMGTTIVKLRYENKVYAGKGVSTDVVGAGIRAYIDAVNKICYEAGVK